MVLKSRGIIPIIAPPKRGTFSGFGWIYHVPPRSTGKWSLLTSKRTLRTSLAMYLIKYLHVLTWAKGWYFGSRYNDQLVHFDKDLQKNEVKAWVHWIPQRILGGWRDTITDLPRNQALLGIICGSRGASGHGDQKSAGVRGSEQTNCDASPQITAHMFWSFPNGMARCIWSILLSIKFPWYQ